MIEDTIGRRICYRYKCDLLLAKVLGGNGKDLRNLVTLWQKPVNSSTMRGFELIFKVLKRLIRIGGRKELEEARRLTGYDEVFDIRRKRYG